jgi:lipoprotein-anchoring transpeptidase ErfK/SrfK
MDSRVCRLLIVITALAVTFGLASCATKDRDHRIVISVPDQQMRVFFKGSPIAEYPVSTSKFALSDHPGSNGTPIGRMEVKKKIGTGALPGAVFKNRRLTGEIRPPDAPGRDPIVTRILWLKGLEPQNRNAYSRYIYIHGTPEERNIGQPASFGCIRMKSRDVIQLFDTVGRGTRVDVINKPMNQIVVEPEA